MRLTHRDMDLPPKPTPSLRPTSDYLKQAATILLLRNGAFIPLFTRQLKQLQQPHAPPRRISRLF